MFGKKTPTKEDVKVVRLPGPKEIPAGVVKYLVAEKKLDAEWLQFVRSVTRANAQGQGLQDIRIFDPAEAEALKVQVKDFTTLEGHPELLMYEGTFNSATGVVQLEEKKKPEYDIKLFTQDEIKQKVEALAEPGSSVMFFMAAGPNSGGPLGRGCAIVELNTGKGKKYNVYTDNVVNMQPAGAKAKLWDSDKVKDVVNWVKQAHVKRFT